MFMLCSSHGHWHILEQPVDQIRQSLWRAVLFTLTQRFDLKHLIRLFCATLVLDSIGLAGRTAPSGPYPDSAVSRESSQLHALSWPVQ